jgi:heptaprenyl diphosphate synthase
MNLMQLAFLTATASSIHIAESLLMRLLPIPFIRLGLSNVVVLYLIMANRPLEAIVVNVTKSVLGGALTFTLLSPGTLLSLAGGMAAILAMYLTFRIPFGLSAFGISVCGAVAHNLAQLYLVKQVILPGTRVFVLTPLLILLGLISGLLIAWIMLLAETKFRQTRLENNEEKR